jgi:hypothetical protein
LQYIPALVKQVSDLSPTMLEKVRHAYLANQQ